MKVKKKVKIRKKQESIKNREWERERRGKLNAVFVQLASLLPDHDPSQPRSKVATLLAAIAHVRHLTQQNHQLIISGREVEGGGERDTVYVAELAKLHDRINTLRARCQQLAQLLQMADIPVPAPRKMASPAAHAQSLKWNGNIAHKTVQRRIITSQKEQAEKKENKELLEVCSTAKKRKKKNSQKVNVTPAERKEESAATEMAAEDESTYLSPLKKVIDLCTTPLRELTGFTLNSASVAASSSSPSSSPSSSISSPSSSLSYNSPSSSMAPSTPTNDQKSAAILENTAVLDAVMTSSAGDVAMATKVATSSGDIAKDMMASDGDASKNTQTNLVANELQPSLEPVEDPSSSASSVLVASESVTTSSSTNTLLPTSSMMAIKSIEEKQNSSMNPTKTLKSVEEKQNPSTNNSTTMLTNSSPVVTQFLKKNTSKSRPKTAIVSSSKSISASSTSSKLITTTGTSSSKLMPVSSTSSKPIPVTGTSSKLITISDTSSKPLPVTGTVHVVKGINPYPSLMPVTVTNTGLNFAAPAVNQSIMIVLPDGRVVSVPQQQSVQSQFVINRTINHQSPTTFVIGNSTPMIEPIVVETTSVEGITVNRAQKIGGTLQQRVLLSKRSDKVPIPMVGTQFVVRRKMDMPVKEKRVIKKQKKSKKVKKTTVSDDATLEENTTISKDTILKDVAMREFVKESTKIPKDTTMKDVTMKEIVKENIKMSKDTTMKDVKMKEIAKDVNIPNSTTTNDKVVSLLNKMNTEKIDGDEDVNPLTGVTSKSSSSVDDKDSSDSTAVVLESKEEPKELPIVKSSGDGQTLENLIISRISDSRNSVAETVPEGPLLENSAAEFVPESSSLGKLDTEPIPEGSLLKNSGAKTISEVSLLTKPTTETVVEVALSIIPESDSSLATFGRNVVTEAEIINQQKAGDKDGKLKKIGGEGRQHNTVKPEVKIVLERVQKDSEEEQLEHPKSDEDRINISDINADEDEADVHFGLDAMSDEDLENNECSLSLTENGQRKRMADHDSRPKLPTKKLKTSEHKNISVEMNLVCEEVLVEDNFNMAAEGLVDDVQMVSSIEDVSFNEQDLKKDADNHQKNHIVKKMSEPCTNKDDISCVDVFDNSTIISPNQDLPNSDMVLAKDMMSPMDKVDRKDNEGKTLSDVPQQNIEVKSVEPSGTTQKTVGEDIESTFATSNNSNTYQASFEAELEKVISNKCNEQMESDESPKTCLLQSCGKVSGVPPTNSSGMLCLDPVSDFGGSSNGAIIGNSVEVGVFAICSEQNNKISSHSVAGDNVVSSNVPSCPISTTNPTTGNSIMNEVLNISSCGLLKETIDTSCFRTTTELETESSTHKNTENNSINFVKGSNSSETSLLPPFANQGSSTTLENTPTDTECTAKQNTAERQMGIESGNSFKNTMERQMYVESVNNKFAVENSSKQIGKPNFIGDKQQKIESQTQTQFDNITKFDNNQKIGLNNVFNGSCTERGGSQHEPVGVLENVLKTPVVSNASVSSNFDSSINTVSNNYMNRTSTSGLMESKNMLWNSVEQIGGNVASMYTNTSAHQNMINSSKSDILTTPENAQSSNFMPSVASAHQNVVNSSKSDTLTTSGPSQNSNSMSASSISTFPSSIASNFTTTTSSSVSSNLLHQTPCSNLNRSLGITQQRPIVSYKINDNVQKTINSNMGCSTAKQWNSKTTFPESTNYKAGNTNVSNSFRSAYVPAVKQCDNCDDQPDYYNHNFIETSGCHHHHHQQFQKQFQNKTVANTSKTIQTGDMSSIYNSNTKIVSNKIKKDIATNTASEQKVVYGSQTYLGNSHDASRKQLEAINNGNKEGLINRSVDKSKESALNKNVRKVVKKTVSQQTDDVVNHQGLEKKVINHQGLGKNLSCIGSNVRKCNMQRTGGFKMKSTSSCQTIESTPINSPQKFPQRNNSFGGTFAQSIEKSSKVGSNAGNVAQNNEKLSTFQVGSNAGGLVAQNNEKSANLQVGSSVAQNHEKMSNFQVASNVAQNNKKQATAATMSDGCQQEKQMEFLSLVPKTAGNSLGSKPVEKQGAPFVRQSRSDKKQEFKLQPIPKEKNSFLDDIRLALPHSDFSNDMFSTLQVPSGTQHHGSLSPTAAFLDAFPLVSNSKNSEMLIDSENTDVHHSTETMLMGETTNNCGVSNITDRQPNQNFALNYNNSGADIGMNANETHKNSCNKSNNSLHSNQIKTGNMVNEQAQQSHSINAKSANTNLEQTSKIQDYQSHYNVQYDYLSANSFQNYNYGSGYKKATPKYPDTNYGNATASVGGSNNSGFGNNLQPYRDPNKLGTNYGQTNEDGLNYNTSIYGNWNSKPNMQNYDDFQTNYMSSYNHFPSSSAPKNVFTSDPPFSTSSSMFGNLATYKDTSSANNAFIAQTPAAVSGSSSKKTGGKSSNNDATASFIYTQASTTSNSVTTRSYSCVFSSASDYQTSVGFPTQPPYSSSSVCQINDSLNTPKAPSSRDLAPALYGSTVTSSATMFQQSAPSVSQSVPTKSTSSVPKTNSSKFFTGVNTLGKKTTSNI